MSASEILKINPVWCVVIHLCQRTTRIVSKTIHIHTSIVYYSVPFDEDFANENVCGRSIYFISHSDAVLLLDWVEACILYVTSEIYNIFICTGDYFSVPMLSMYTVEHQSFCLLKCICVGVQFYICCSACVLLVRRYNMLYCKKWYNSCLL